MSDVGVRRDRPLLMAALVVLLSALVWSLFKGVLEFGIGLIVVAVIGGWGIGVLVKPIHRAPLVAVALAALAWLAGLVGTWLIAMLLLPGSSRTFLERLQATPFVDWLAPQFGLLEIVGLALFVVAAAYGARPERQPGKS